MGMAEEKLIKGSDASPSFFGIYQRDPASCVLNVTGVLYNGDCGPYSGE